jgi:hypothetical protein
MQRSGVSGRQPGGEPFAVCPLTPLRCVRGSDRQAGRLLRYAACAARTNKPAAYSAALRARLGQTTRPLMDGAISVGNHPQSDLKL